MEKINFFDNIFFSFKKIIFIIPVVILFLGLVLKYNKQPPTQEKKLPSPVITKSVTSEVKLDLNGPLVCQYSSSTASISAFIKNKQVYGEKIDKETNFYLLKNDCLYSWQKEDYQGKKVCGLSPYLSLMTITSSFGLSNINSFLSLVPNLGVKDFISSNSAEIEGLVKSCKKEEIIDVQIFKIPENILFKDR